jgi:hypothetical protein
MSSYFWFVSELDFAERGLKIFISIGVYSIAEKKFHVTESLLLFFYYFSIIPYSLYSNF